jgi:hypothetical protein
MAVELQELGSGKKQGLRKIGRMRLAAVDNASGGPLKPFAVEKGGEIATDGWLGHSFAENPGYRHAAHVHSKKKEGGNPLTEARIHEGNNPSRRFRNQALPRDEIHHQADFACV